MILSSSSSDFSMKGFRSRKAPDEQNFPMLEVVKDDTTSGPFEPPARSAWLSLSSLMFPTTLTVMFGCAFSNRSTFSWMAFTSVGALQPCQKVMVVLASGLSVAPDEDCPVQAVARRAREAEAASAIAVFLD